MRVCMPSWFTHQCARVPTGQKSANFLFLCANVSINVLTCYTACQCFNLACQRAKRRANVSTWRTNVPKGMPTFRTFLVRHAKGNFYTYHSYIYHVYVSYIQIVLNFISILHFILKLVSAIFYQIFIFHQIITL